MSTHLITGFAGKEHITSADQGSYNAAVMGGGEFVLERGEQFRCQVISNNKVRIYDGDALMQGRHIIIDRNTYEETTHDNGTQGYKRIDLIVLTYEKNAVSSVESVKLEVIKGAPAESNPAVPEYIKGDILNSGASKNQMPLYQIPFDGLSIGEPVQLFYTVPTLEGMKKDIDEKVDAKIAEFEEDFAGLEAGIEDKIEEAGKPLASNATDWAMIENYGEYSADAKTVGEEFAKVNNSLFEVDNLIKKYIELGYLPDLENNIIDTRQNSWLFVTDTNSRCNIDNGRILFSCLTNSGNGCVSYIPIDVTNVRTIEIMYSATKYTGSYTSQNICITQAVPEASLSYTKTKSTPIGRDNCTNRKVSLDVSQYTGTYNFALDFTGLDATISSVYLII